MAQGLECRREWVWGVVMAKVYVSSTIIDLQEERQAVLDWLRLARHQAVDSYCTCPTARQCGTAAWTMSPVATCMC